MNRIWVWISIANHKSPDVEATDIDTDTDVHTDIETEIGANTNEGLISDKTLNNRIDLQYKKIQLEAGKLTKRRRELRKKDPLNDGPDSSDDSIDERAPKRVRTSGGIKPRKRKNKNNETCKQADGKSKRLYTYSDSEQDSEGHDPTGNSRTKKRVKLSKSKENFMSYIQRGPADGIHSRSLVRPDDDLLGALMTNRQQLRYQAPFNKKRKVVGDAVVVQLGDRREHLDKAIFKKGYYRIAVHLKEKYSLEEGFTLEYATVSNPDLAILDSEGAFSSFSNDLSILECEGTIHITPLPTVELPFIMLDKTRIRSRNCVVMTEAKPTGDTITHAYPWIVSPIEDISKFSSLDEFLKALLKGNDWEQWYPNLLTIWFASTPEAGHRYILLTEDELKKLKLKPRRTLWFEIRKNYEGAAVSILLPITALYIGS